jgi:hypothetical protein
MALTPSKEHTLVFGNRKVRFARLTFSGVTSGTYVTGLPDVENLQFVNLTDNSRAVVTDVTSTAGSIAFSAVTASDVIDIMAVGPY